MTKIIIVAGGLATRLRPITEKIPKCLVDVNGRPLIQHQLEFFKERGFTDIIFCIAHLADKVKQQFGDGSGLGMDIRYVEETDELMGTAGSVRLAEHLIGEGEDFIVYYGDNLTSMDFGKFMRFHKEKGALGTICMRPVPEGYRSSSLITLDDNHKVSSFIERPTDDELEKQKGRKRYINSGIYMFSSSIFSHIPEGRAYDFGKDLFPSLVETDQPLYGYPTEEFFRELGTVKKYEKFLEEFRGKDRVL